MEGALDLFAMASALMDDEDVKPSYDKIKEWLEDDSTVEYGFSDSRPGVLTCNNCELSLEWLLINASRESFALFNGAQFSLTEYLDYAYGRALTDRNPLYLFEDLSIVDNVIKKKIVDLFPVPDCVPKDIFDDILRDVQGRPRFRWLLIGPERSGSHLHIDPFGTSAWNTLLQGSKRWVFLPPQYIPQHDKKSIYEWFQENDKIPEALYATQKAGETFFVPAGWWHAVINLEFTLAITQNWASEINLEKIKKEVEESRPSEFKEQWLSLQR